MQCPVIMAKITHLNKRHHAAAASRQRRNANNTLIRFGVSFGALSLALVAIFQLNASSSLTETNQHFNGAVVSPANLLRNQRMLVQQTLERHVATKKKTSTTKKTTTTNKKAKKKTITKKVVEEPEPESQVDEDGAVEEPIEDGHGEDVGEPIEDKEPVEEPVDEEEDTDGADAEPVEKDPADEAKDTLTKKKGISKATKKAAKTEDNKATKKTGDEDTGNEGTGDEDIGDEETGGEEKAKPKKGKTTTTKKTKKKGGVKTPEEIKEEIMEEIEEEEEEFWDGGLDSGPVEPEEISLSDIPPRKFKILIANLTPSSQGKTKASLTIVTHPDWAPIGAKHFHDLVESGFYKNNKFFRVVPNFVAQFGINGDPLVNDEAEKVVLEDDPVMHTNARGTISYATKGPNTRTTQLFFNIRPDGNEFLDSQGFAPFAEVVEGLEVLDRIYKDYGEKPKQSKIHQSGDSYLDKNYPKLSYIKHIWEEKIEKVDESS